MGTRFFTSSRGLFGLTVVGAVAIGLGSWLSVGPATATPGMTCNPEPGHYGCHVPATTTTAKPTTTTAKPTTTTAKPATTTTKAGTTTTKGTTGTTGVTTDTTAGVTTSTATTTSSPPTSAGTVDSTTSTTGGATETSATTVPVAPPVGVEPTPYPVSPRYLDEKNCLSCHADRSLVKKRADGTSVSLYVDTENLLQAVHRYLDCVECHGSDPHAVQSPLTGASQAQSCGGCHRYQYNQFSASIHGTEQAMGNADSATCADCHSADSNPHNVVRVLDPSAAAYPKNIADTCARCHEDPELMGDYGLMEKVYDSYMRSFHGKALELWPDNAAIQELNIATCVSCHGAHNIKAVDDPTATVAGMDNLVTTCEQCHPGAGPEFVNGFLGHREANPDYLPEVYWGERSIFVLSRAMLAGGVLIVATSIGLRGIRRLGVRGVPGAIGRAIGRIKPRRKKEE